MHLSEIDAAISTCAEHLDASGARGSEIEAFLTQYVLIRICANFEERVQFFLSRPVQNVADEYVRALAEQGVRHISQGSKTSDIAEMLQRIDPILRDRFRSSVSNTPGEQSFNQLVTSRNLTAHDRGSSFTFNELVEHYNRAHTVLDSLRDAIAG